MQSAKLLFLSKKTTIDQPKMDNRGKQKTEEIQGTIRINKFMKNLQFHGKNVKRRKEKQRTTKKIKTEQY